MSAPLLTFRDGEGVRVDLDRLITSRALVQANSGGGKSRAIRYILEQTFGRVQHFVFDPEGEFGTLREKFDYVLAAKTGGEAVASARTAKLLCRRLVELGASAVFDLNDLDIHERREFVKLFITELMALPRSLWKPIIVVIDEAHMFAPERGSGEAQSTAAVIQLCTQGRKRGFCAVLATQRISKLHKDAAAELLNKLIGRTGLDVDVKRAGEELGFDKDQRQTLKRLEPGQFYAYGPAIANRVQIVRTGKVLTTHPEPGTISSAPAPTPSKVKAMLSQLVDLPQEAEQEARSVAELQKQVRQLKGDLTRAQRERGTVDPADVQRQIIAGVERARTTWTKDVRRIVARDLDRLAKAIDIVSGTSDRLLTQLSDTKAAFLSLDTSFGAEPRIPLAVAAPERPPVAASRPRSTPVTQRPAKHGEGYQIIDETLSTPQQKMLDALASFEAIGLKTLAKAHVAVFSDQSSRSSGFRANISTLSAKGLIERVDSDTVRLTDDGRAAASEAAAPATLDELHESWLKKLSGPQRLILSLLIESHPSGIDRDDLAKQSGQSPLSSGYRANLSTLSALGLTKKESGELVASDLLYPEGL